ncbi:MAG: chemotaxis protein CheA, partial [Bacteroidota bacterium]
LRRLSAGEEAVPMLAEKRRELQLRYLAEEKEVITRACQEGSALWHVTVSLRPDCLLKGARAFMILRELSRLGDIMRSLPDAKDLEDEKFQDTFLVGLLSKEPEETIVGTVRQITDVASVGAERMSLENLQIERRAASPLEPSQAEAAAKAIIERAPASPTVRVEIRKLDDLMNTVVELVINRSRLEQLYAGVESKELAETLEQMARLTLDLQSRVLKTRMVPVDNVFRRFPRLVRDLAKETGKQAVLVMRGGDTELDRTVIDEIGDPLMHILRNCLDHGIETPAERVAAGKSATGTVTLEAHQEGNSVVIKISDDGQGLQLDRIASRALEQNLVTEAQLSEMTPQDIAQLIFAPGLSTAEKVSDISGRGVGMDAVKTKIESLRGMVSVDTTPGQGTTVTIRLPLTLAIIQTLMVQLGEEVFLIPSSYIDSTISVLRKDIKKVRNQEVTMVRGEVLPLIRLQDALGMTMANNNAFEELDVVVIHQGERKLGCIVDRLLRQQDVVLKPLGHLLGNLRGIAGATILGDGRVALILDVRSVA